MPGDNDRIMAQMNITILLASDGSFTGVKQGDKTYTIDEWNAKMKKTPTTQAEGTDTGIPPMR